MKQVKPIYVEWVDSAGTSGWSNKEELHTHALKCRSVGWLIEENDECLIICLNHAIPPVNREYGEVVTIPKVAVTKKKFLKL